MYRPDDRTRFNRHDRPSGSCINGHIKGYELAFPMDFNRNNDKIIFWIKWEFDHTFKAAPKERAKRVREQRIYGLLTWGDFNKESQTTSRLGL